jgi:hypothetical protein
MTELEKLKKKYEGKYFKDKDNLKYVFIKLLDIKEVNKITLDDFDEMINFETKLEFPEYFYVGIEITLKKYYNKYYSMNVKRGTFNFILNNPFVQYIELTNIHWHNEIDRFNNILLNTYN